MNRSFHFNSWWFSFLLNFILFFNLLDNLYSFVSSLEQITTEPRMRKQILHGGSFPGLNFQTLGNNIQTFCTEFLSNIGIDPIPAHFNSLDSFLRIPTFKRLLPRQHTEKYNPTRPHINPPINFILFELDKTLWSHIGQTASIEVLPRESFYHTGDTEIYYLYVLCLGVY